MDLSASDHEGHADFDLRALNLYVITDALHRRNKAVEERIRSISEHLGLDCEKPRGDASDRA